MTLRLAPLVVAGLVAVAACAGTDAESEDTVPATAAAEEPFTPVSEPVTSEAPAPTTPTSSTTTSSLVPAADADLPTAAPSESSEPQPVTTAPGPLPTPTVQLVEVASFEQPVDAAHRQLDPRLAVVQQGGQVVAFDDESNTVVLDMADVDDISLSDANEQGLLGLAFHPALDLAYVNYTNGDDDTVIAEFAVDPGTLAFDPSTYREVLTFEQPFANHNGGDLEFGPDGHLYIATGDGGSADDPERNSLDLTNRLGKLLRIDPLPSGDGSAFSVPDDNPFLGADDADPTIWSYGLRNPWKFSFDPLTGDLWIGDVGQGAFEEIDLAPATNGFDAGRGLSFGWSAFEGSARFNDDQLADGHVPPVVEYPHSEGGCSVSAGAVARTSSYSALNGWYVYGDFCSGQLWALDTTSVGISDSTVVGTPVIVEIGSVSTLTAVVEGADGDLYALSLDGQLFRIVQG